MALLSDIRKRSGLVIGLIGVAIVAFLISDAISSNRNGLFGGGRPGLGSVYGEDLSADEFAYKLNNAKENYRQQQPNASMDEATEADISNQVWDQLVTGRVLQKEYAALGLTVTQEEIIELVAGPNPHPIVLQSLVDPKTGKLDQQLLYNYFNNPASITDPRARQFVAEFKQYLTSERLKEKYTSLVKRAYYTTDLEAEDEFRSRSQMGNFRYIQLPLSSISDTTVELSDGDYRTYYNKNKEKFKKGIGRSVEYVTWEVRPSAEDSQAVQASLAKQGTAFKATQNDSSYAARNSRGNYQNKLLPRGSFPASIEDILFASEAGTVIGPYYEQDAYKLAKVVAVGRDSLPVYRARHILLKPEDDDTAATIVQANKVLAEIKGGANFEEKARELSQDPGSAVKGGDLGWFRGQTMVKAFGDAVKSLNKGGYKIVKTEFGVHIIELTEEPSYKTVNAAIIEKTVRATDKTDRAAFNRALGFRGSLADASQFSDAVTKAGMNKRIADNIKPNDKTVPGLSNPRALITWLYGAKKGEISDPIKVGDQYIVAVVTNVREDEYADLEEVKVEIEGEVRNEKKRDMLEEKIQEAMGSGKSLDDVAKALGATVAQAPNVSFETGVTPGIANEPRVVGWAFGAPAKTVSSPIRGTTGVFVVEAGEKTAVTVPENFANERKTITTQRSSMLDNAMMKVLKEDADIKDFRYMLGY